MVSLLTQNMWRTVVDVAILLLSTVGKVNDLLVEGHIADAPNKVGQGGQGVPGRAIVVRKASKEDIATLQDQRLRSAKSAKITKINK